MGRVAVQGSWFGAHAELFGTILSIFVDEVTRHHVRRALALGLTD